MFNPKGGRKGKKEQRIDGRNREKKIKIVI